MLHPNPSRPNHTPRNYITPIPVLVSTDGLRGSSMTPNEEQAARATHASSQPPDEEVAAKLATLNAQVAAELQARERASRAEAEAASAAQARLRRRPQLWMLVQLPLLLALPFVVLIGGAVWLYRVHAVPTWLALAGSGAVTATLLTAYGARVSKRVTGKARLRFVGTKLALPLVVFYCGYTLVFLSSVNAKTDEVRQYYRTVHPLLRVALSTVILIDRDIVVTDAKRDPADYARMGLPLLDNSLHFPQQDGYAHAVDLRTTGRDEWRNLFLAGFFRVLGFRTLRHIGTADHLHVSIAPPGDMRR